MQVSHRRVLMLNADYTPIGTIDWRRAVVLADLNRQDYRAGAQVIDFYKDDFILDSKGRRHPIPAVIRNVAYIKQRKKTVPFSRKNIFIRDQLTCQYCAKQYSPDELTYDHVIPRAQWDRKNGTPTHWENIVTCCRTCNSKKADKTPKQAKMHLIKQPIKPSSHGYVFGLSPWSKMPEEWIVYLPRVYQQQQQFLNAQDE